MQWTLLLGLFFSLNVLYLVTCAFIMMVPEDVSAISDKDKDTQRVESAVIVNSLVLAVLGLMLAARVFSALGELMVELLYQLIHRDPDNKNATNAANSTAPKVKLKASSTAASQAHYHKPEPNEPQHTLLNLQDKPLLKIPKVDYSIY